MKIKNFDVGKVLNDIRTTVNSVCSNGGLSMIFKRFGNAMYGPNGFMARPIGIVGKNYNIIRNTLSQNIGNGLFSFDGHGTPISSLANINLTADTTIPWFKTDMYKKEYDNYLSYMNDVYFNGTMPFPNFVSQDIKAKFFNYNSLLLDNNKVGAIRKYDINDAFLASNLFANGNQTNPNSFTDTRIGVVNNFYLNATLRNTSFHRVLNINGNITNGAYDLFGFFGQLGMVNGDISLKSGEVLEQTYLTDQVIYSTPLDDDRAYGVYDSTIASFDIINASNLKTQQCIYKSLLGFDLINYKENVVLDDYDITDYSSITNKKYIPKKGNSYLSFLGIGTSMDTEPINNNLIRLVLDSNSVYTQPSRTLYVYAESEMNKSGGSPYTGNNTESWNKGVEYGIYTPYHRILDNNIKPNDIVSYTNRCFQLGKYDTLIARFHSDKSDIRDLLSSAVSQYGMSHGRNLLKKDHANDSVRMADGNGYSDPYCRVWTFHKQYSKLENLIRPLYGNADNMENTIVSDYQHNRSRLERYGVKDASNRLVRITPTKEDKNIKNCMFSIENLAWKYEKASFDGYESQRGPLGGRIMWFPPYGLSFSEDVSVNWNSTQFIGRGENIYTYTNTERSGTLRFKLLIDHPSLLNIWKDENGGADTEGSVDDVTSREQKILRFFAGCEILEERPKEEEEEIVIIEEEQPTEPKPEPIQVPTKIDGSIYFYVFFPNDYSGVDDSANGFIKPMEYLLNGIGCQKRDGKVDIGTSLDIQYNLDGSPCGGYEVGRGAKYGVSCGLKLDNDLSIIASNSGADTTISPYQHRNKNGKISKWGYRVDEMFADEVFRNNASYYDTTDLGLNGKNYTKLLNYHTDAKEYGDDLVSFVNMACALEPNAKTTLQGLYDEDVVKTLTLLLDEFDVVEVKASGFASSHGYVKNNNKLNENRANSVLSWLNKCNPTKFPLAKCTIAKTGIGQKLSHNDANSIDAKVWRCVKVEIKLLKEEVVEQQSATHEVANQDDTLKVCDNQIMTNNQSSFELPKINPRESLYEKNMKKYFPNTMVGAQENATMGAIDIALEKARQVLADAKTKTIKIKKQTNKSKYGDEYEFFSRLSKENPFLHNKVVDKIKFFDPAYHSITPEGFNARLTFLHQCTRQGSTNSASDTSFARTAHNLSFGTPPICVLRIGDFYNTKIVINSLSINYEDVTWDLNDEGIGVMPMIADVSIAFKFIGGSDLTGPITRLQNAVSFNYYANTVVYDNRAEMVEYDDNGQIITLKKQ